MVYKQFDFGFKGVIPLSVTLIATISKCHYHSMAVSCPLGFNDSTRTGVRVCEFYAAHPIIHRCISEINMQYVHAIQTGEI